MSRLIKKFTSKGDFDVFLNANPQITEIILGECGVTVTRGTTGYCPNYAKTKNCNCLSKHIVTIKGSPDPHHLCFANKTWMLKNKCVLADHNVIIGVFTTQSNNKILIKTENIPTNKYRVEIIKEMVI